VDWRSPGFVVQTAGFVCCPWGVILHWRGGECTHWEENASQVRSMFDPCSVKAHVHFVRPSEMTSRATAPKIGDVFLSIFISNLISHTSVINTGD